MHSIEAPRGKGDQENSNLLEIHRYPGEGFRLPSGIKGVEGAGNFKSFILDLKKQRDLKLIFML